MTASITKRVTRLSDGRELIYFDDADSVLRPERPADTRPPRPRPLLPAMRQDPLSGEWISIAPARQGRVVLPPDHQDPLAPSGPGRATEIPGPYDVAVFENQAPSFGPGFDWDGADDDDGGEQRPAIGIGRTRPAYGRCEVICFGPELDAPITSLSLSRVRTVVEAWADRTEVLSRQPGVRQVFAFENSGDAIGVTLRHPHGQIYAYPYVTPRTRKLLNAIESYGPGLLQDVLEYEQRGSRVLIRGEHFTVFVPFAARWPIEIHALAHRDVPNLAATTGEERDELAMIYKRTLQAVNALYDTPTPYIAAWHQAPVLEGRDAVRLMLQITSPRRDTGKLKYLAGSESAMEAFVGDLLAESTAERLRAALGTVGD